MYLGQTEVPHANLEVFIKTGKELEVKGLTDNIETNVGKNTLTEDIPIEEEESIEAIVKCEEAEPDPIDAIANMTSDIDAGPIESQIFNSINDFAISEPVSWPSVKSESKYACDRCDYRSTLSSNLKAHIMAKHEGIKFRCQLCDKAFSNQCNLNRHKRTAHTASFPNTEDHS